MNREAPRTIRSLIPSYQNVDANLYEIVLVENGSSGPLDRELVRKLSPNLRYFYIHEADPSPAAAVNFGVAQSRGAFVGISIDGARIFSPGIIKYSLIAFKAYANPVISTLGWHLGPDIQGRSMQNGYDQDVEDKLLQSINWPEDGYRLFEISVLAGSSVDGWFQPMAESNCVMLKKETFNQLHGFDERFNLPGGGLVNLDFYKRACQHPQTRLVTLLGEGTFHQIHGGVSTGVSPEKNVKLWKIFEAQYIKLRGMGFSKPSVETDYLGRVPREALPSLMGSAKSAYDNAG